MDESSENRGSEVDELVWTAMAGNTARRLLQHSPGVGNCISESNLTGWFNDAIAAAVLTDRIEREKYT